MSKILKTIAVAMILANTALADKPKLLKDGTAITGVNGRLIRDETAGKWIFELADKISDDKVTLGIRKKIELLPTNTLETMVASIKENPAGFVRLWGKVTRYKNRNFIFSAYFLPVIGLAEKPQPKAKTKSDSPAINEPDDAVVIPKEVVEMMHKKRHVRVAQLQKALESGKDFVLAGRMGYVNRPDANEPPVFVFDALGQNIQTDLKPILLNCKVLEKIQSAKSKSLGPIRFKIAGIMTKYQGNRYLLLQRATRNYSHGNFTR